MNTHMSYIKMPVIEFANTLHFDCWSETVGINCLIFCARSSPLQLVLVLIKALLKQWDEVIYNTNTLKLLCSVADKYVRLVVILHRNIKKNPQQTADYF